MTPEGKVKAQVKKTLDKLGAYYFMPIGGPYASRGVPDFIGCIGGRFFGIETKAGNRTPTALQERELRRIQEAGGIALLINESNLHMVEEKLSEAQNSNG